MNVETLYRADTFPIHSHQFEQRFILVRLGQLTLVFPATMVTEILIVELSKILTTIVLTLFLASFILWYHSLKLRSLRSLR